MKHSKASLITLPGSHGFDFIRRIHSNLKTKELCTTKLSHSGTGSKTPARILREPSGYRFTKSDSKNLPGVLGIFLSVEYVLGEFPYICLRT